MPNATIQHARDGNSIRAKQRDHLQRDDGVESDGGPNVDERQQHGEQTRNRNRISWDFLGGVHAAEPLAKGEAVVAGEGEGLARRRRVEGDVCRDDEDQDEDGERVDAGRADGVFEHVDEGVAGRVG